MHASLEQLFVDDDSAEKKKRQQLHYSQVNVYIEYSRILSNMPFHHITSHRTHIYGINCANAGF